MNTHIQDLLSENYKTHTDLTNGIYDIPKLDNTYTIRYKPCVTIEFNKTIEVHSEDFFGSKSFVPLKKEFLAPFILQEDEIIIKIYPKYRGDGLIQEWYCIFLTNYGRLLQTEKIQCKKMATQQIWHYYEHYNTTHIVETYKPAILSLNKFKIITSVQLLQYKMPRWFFYTLKSSTTEEYQKINMEFYNFIHKSSQNNISTKKGGTEFNQLINSIVKTCNKQYDIISDSINNKIGIITKEIERKKEINKYANEILGYESSKQEFTNDEILNIIKETKHNYNKIIGDNEGLKSQNLNLQTENEGLKSQNLNLRTVNLKLKNENDDYIKYLKID